MAEAKNAGQVLIAEDDRNIASLVQTYLEQAGFKATVALDGHATLDFVQKNDPAFIILDWMLPGIDGAEVCREIRKTSDVPILMLTVCWPRLWPWRPREWLSNGRIMPSFWQGKSLPQRSRLRKTALMFM